MDNLPFILIVGTKSKDTGREEYRWTALLCDSVPGKDAIFCRDETGAMKKDFLIKEFINLRKPFPDVNTLLLDLSRYYWVKRNRFAFQIEHFPDEYFPE